MQKHQSVPVGSLLSSIGLSACLLLVGCGGGNSKPAEVAPVVPVIPVVETLPRGAWAGTMVASNGTSTDITCMVTEAGAFMARTKAGVVMFSDLKKPTVQGGAWALGPGNKFINNKNSASAIIQMTSFTPKVDFLATYQIAGESGDLKFTTYNSAYDAPLALADAAGTYVGTVLTAGATSTYTLIIKADGTITGTDTIGTAVIGRCDIQDATKSLLSVSLDPIAVNGNFVSDPTLHLTGFALLAPRSGAAGTELTLAVVGLVNAGSGVLVKQ